eukprot:m.570383 g.570383  ORF g.570383 m.570383 type:complete len:444 (+) comp57852_c0_seq17:210-1541(+)
MLHSLPHLLTRRSSRPLLQLRKVPSLGCVQSYRRESLVQTFCKNKFVSNPSLVDSSICPMYLFWQINQLNAFARTAHPSLCSAGAASFALANSTDSCVPFEMLGASFVASLDSTIPTQQLVRILRLNPKQGTFSVFQDVPVINATCLHFFEAFGIPFLFVGQQPSPTLRSRLLKFDASSSSFQNYQNVETLPASACSSVPIPSLDSSASKSALVIIRGHASSGVDVFRLSSSSSAFEFRQRIPTDVTLLSATALLLQGTPHLLVSNFTTVTIFKFDSSTQLFAFAQTLTLPQIQSALAFTSGSSDVVVLAGSLQPNASAGASSYLFVVGPDQLFELSQTLPATSSVATSVVSSFVFGNQTFVAFADLMPASTGSTTAGPRPSVTVFLFESTSRQLVSQAQVFSNSSVSFMTSFNVYSDALLATRSLDNPSSLVLHKFCNGTFA